MMPSIAFGHFLHRHAWFNSYTKPSGTRTRRYQTSTSEVTCCASSACSPDIQLASFKGRTAEDSHETIPSLVQQQDIKSSSLEGLLEHRWRSGAALYEMHIYRELAMDDSNTQQTETNILDAKSYSVSVPPESSTSSASNAEATRSKLLEQLRRVHGEALQAAGVGMEPGTIEVDYSSRHVQAELDQRRHARRLRRQQADMAAAVAGAIAGVEPKAVLAAAQARLLEERRATGAAASFRGAGLRLRQWDALRETFNAADSALLRQPRVMRSVNEALLQKGRKQASHHLLSREEELSLIETMRAGQRLQIFMASWQRAAGRAPSLEEVAAQGLLGSAKSIREVMDSAADAQERLVRCNVMLVHKIAQQYRSHSTVTYDDLIQAGLEGLQDGLRRFQPARGSRLGTCLYFSIRNGVVREFRRQNRVVAIPSSTQEEQAALERAIATFTDAHRRAPTVEEMSAASGFSGCELRRLLRLRATREVLSGTRCTAPSGRSGNGRATNDPLWETWGDTLEGAEEEQGVSERAAVRLELQRLLDVAIGSLPPKERAALRAFYGLDGRPRSQKEIGQLLSTSERYVSQLINKARRQLRKQHAQTLLAYL